MEKFHVQHHRQNGPAVAIVLIIVGALFLGFNLGLIQERYRPILISWEMLLIVLGAISLFKRHFVSGFILLSLGVFFLLPKVVAISSDFAQVYWPIMLIFVGIILLFHRFVYPKRNHCSTQSYDWHHVDSTISSEHQQAQGEFHKNVVFGNEEFLVLDTEFKGGDINVTFGEIKIDLRKTQLATAKVAVEINVQFGNVVIFVPSDWKVQLQVNCVFGGFEDKRIFSPDRSDQDKTLVIYGSTTFGGGELRN